MCERMSSIADGLQCTISIKGSGTVNIKCNRGAKGRSAAGWWDAMGLKMGFWKPGKCLNM